MAEFCLYCWNKLMGTKEPAKKYIISKYPDLCEGCEELKPVVVRMKLHYILKELIIPEKESK